MGLWAAGRHIQSDLTSLAKRLEALVCVSRLRVPRTHSPDVGGTGRSCCPPPPTARTGERASKGARGPGAKGPAEAGAPWGMDAWLASGVTSLAWPFMTTSAVILAVGGQGAPSSGETAAAGGLAARSLRPPPDCCCYSAGPWGGEALTASRIHPALCSLQPPSGPRSFRAQQCPQSQGPRHSISLRPARN